MATIRDEYEIEKENEMFSAQAVYRMCANKENLYFAIYLGAHWDGKSFRITDGSYNFHKNIFSDEFIWDGWNRAYREKR